MNSVVITLISIKRLLHILFFACNVNQNVIEVHNNKNIKFFYQDIIDIALESSRCISQSKIHHLILKMVIIDSKNCLLFIAFLIFIEL